MRESFERLLVGRVLADRYEVEEKIGSGGMSVVYAGRDRRLGRPVAVKVVSLAAESPAERAGLRERFRREAASAARIPHHPNVVQVFDYGTDPELDLDFLVMELLRGRDLKEALRGTPLPADEALRILREAARGLAAGHRAGIVHRDVKPANLFLTGEDGLEAVRILDFGIAKPLEPDPAQDLTRTGQLPHSPAYAAPEQLDTHRPLTFASDVYQLGLIGYEMLSGERPFSVEERALLGSGTEVPLQPRGRWASVPGPVRGVIEQALRFRPEDRFPDAAAFAEALAGAVEAPRVVPVPVVDDGDHTIATPAATARPAPAPAPLPTGVPVRGSRSGKHARQRMLFVAVPVVLLLLAVGVWAMRDSAPAPLASDEPDSATLAARDDEFLRLQGQVGQSSPSGGPLAADTASASPARAAAPGPRGAVGVMAQAEQEIRNAVHDLNQAWVDGEISRHVSHYASRVHYYNSRRLPRAGVRRDRLRDLRRYSETRQIGIHDIRIEFTAPDQARALVDKEWLFASEDRTRRGRGVQEYLFKRDSDDGRWYVISEQLLSTTEQRSVDDT